MNDVNALGQPIEATDVNSVWTKSQYGRFGQAFYSYNKTGGWQKVIRRWAHTSNAPDISEPHYFVQIATSATAPPQWAYFDTLVVR